MVSIKILSNKYSFKTGLIKTFKNLSIFLLPSLVAWQGSVPVEYAWVAAGVLYFVKNFINNN